MSEEITPISTRRLPPRIAGRRRARSPLRLLPAPFVFALTGASAVFGGWVLGGIGGAGLAIAGSLAIGSGPSFAPFVFSVSAALPAGGPPGRVGGAPRGGPGAGGGGRGGGGRIGVAGRGRAGQDRYADSAAV